MKFCAGLGGVRQARCASGDESGDNVLLNTVCIMGLGYIGLPTAAVAAAAGYNVLGVDVRDDRVQGVNAGETYIVEEGMAELVSQTVADGRLKAAKAPDVADVFVIAVPTPLNSDNQPDMKYVDASVDAIIPVLRSGNTVIIESTSPIGTTARAMLRIATARPDLKMPEEGSYADDTISIAYCPERVLPGQMIRELQENDRVIGGVTAHCAEKAAGFYRCFLTKGACFQTTAATAEMVKLSENAFRDVNIAFANELSIIAETHGINPWDLVRLANRHPRVNILQPGAGVGGHCIAVDPWFLVATNPDDAHLVRAAREVNLGKSRHVATKIADSVKETKASTVAIFGLAYKPNIDDLRESPSINIVKDVASDGELAVLVVEPHVELLPEEINLPNVQLVSAELALQDADIIVLLVAHDAFRGVVSDFEGRQVLDICGLLV